MDLDQALKTLELSPEATHADVVAAKRRLVHALHPDRHPAEQGRIFARLTQEVIAAAEFLEKHLPGRREAAAKKVTPKDDDRGVEATLFEDDEAAAAFDELAAARGTIIRFGHRFTTDGKLAIGVRGIDQAFQWHTTTFAGQGTQHVGSALYVVVQNRTTKPVSSLYLGQMSYLIDDRGHQYTPKDSFFYWPGEDGAFNHHGDFLAPRAKVEGFILFPTLRAASKRFERYVIHGSFQIGSSADGFEERYYDVALC